MGDGRNLRSLGAGVATSYGSSGSTMGPGEALFAALSPVGAWQGMQKAWNNVSEGLGGANPTITPNGGTFVTPHSELLFDIKNSPTVAKPSVETITLSLSDQDALNNFNESQGILQPQATVKMATGAIYKVPGNATPSGKACIGRHNKPNPAKTRRSNDGRDRKKAQVVDTYDTNNPGEGRNKEQKAIDDNGGVDNLDNKRNEVKKAKKP